MNYTLINLKTQKWTGSSKSTNYHTQSQQNEFSSVAQSCPTLCDPMKHSMPGLPVHDQLPSSLRLTSIESVMPSSHLILCHPLLLLPSIFPSIRVNSSHEVAKVLELQLQHHSFHKSLLQHHSSKASILRHSAFFTVQLSHPYMTTGKTIALTRNKVKMNINLNGYSNSKVPSNGNR